MIERSLQLGLRPIVFGDVRLDSSIKIRRLHVHLNSSRTKLRRVLKETGAARIILSMSTTNSLRFFSKHSLQVLNLIIQFFLAQLELSQLS